MKHVLSFIALLVLAGCSLDWTPPAAKDAGGDGAKDVAALDARTDKPLLDAPPFDGSFAPDSAADARLDGVRTDATGDVPTRPADANLPALDLLTTALPNATAGARYSFTLSATGGSAPLTWAIASGRLPTGITLDGATGTISGTSAAVGTAELVLSVTDTSTPAQSQSRSFTLTVGAATALSVVTVSLPSAVVGQSYGQPVNAAGGVSPYRWGISSGALPAGLTLNADTGVIAGTPISAGTANFVLQANDVSTPAQTASRTLSIVVVSPLSVATTSLPAGVVGRVYSGTLAATGGAPPYQWSVSSGTLPTGITLDASGTLTGTPGKAGDITVSFAVKDSTSTAQTAGVSLTVSVAAQLVITPVALPNGKEATPYSAALSATGGRAPLTWTIDSGNLPQGIAMDATSGLIHGTPLSGSAGVYSLVVAVADTSSPAQRVTASLSLRILATVSITTLTLPGATAGAAYRTTLVATGGLGPYRWALGGGTLPGGISISQTGDVQGTPTTAGSFIFTASASDSATPAGSAQRQFTLVVAAALALQPATLPSGLTGQSYAATLTATGGTRPYQWQLRSGALPAGLTLNASTGQITGTPTRAETASFTIRVTDANNSQADSAPVSITIAAGLTIVTTTLPVAVRGANYSATLKASGGTAPYTWTITAGTLPRNLTLQSNTGIISGTVNARDTAGPTPLTIQVRDSGTPLQQKSVVLFMTVQ